LGGGGKSGGVGGRDGSGEDAGDGGAEGGGCGSALILADMARVWLDGASRFTVVT